MPATTPGKQRWDFLGTISAFAKASLPALGVPGFIRRVTNDILGPWYLGASLKWYSLLHGAVNCDEYADLNAAISAIGGTKRVLVITSAQTANTATIPGNLKVHIVPGAGGQITVNSGQTLTINGQIEAPQN
ncbi:MAG: hypothetical protein ACRDRT_09445, partial [Pseudonocardiaceae bacterium]